MRVPEPVRIVFDKFPLQELEAIDAVDPVSPKKEPLLGVYSLDEEGFPLDPRCLELYCYLLLRGESPKPTVMSPYVTSSHTLPVLWTRKTKEATEKNDPRARVITTLAQASTALGDELVSDPKIKIFRSMVDTWVADAWHETIMSPVHDEIRARIYAEASSESMPWPFSKLVLTQLDEHLDTRHLTAKQASGDDYVCGPENLHRAAMALNALSTVINSPLTAEPTLFDLMVFSYTWPIIQVLGESALASLLPPMLRQHSQEVRSFFVNIR